MLLPLAFVWLVSSLTSVSGYKHVSDDTLTQLPGPGPDFDIKKGSILAPILRPRVSGTEGNNVVRQHIIDFFKAELPNWRLELHNSTSTTPVSEGKAIPFVNFIATRDPPGSLQGDVARLVLVAHYDSKYTPEGFIGAIDSAAPCAMLMHIARSIDPALTEKWATTSTNDFDVEHKGVQIIFLDGEEAFQSWTDTDSIYGARALAEDWESTLHTATSKYRTPLDSIELFLLLDLLGSAQPNVPSYFKSTHWAYQHMARVEERLRNLGLMKSSPNHASKLAQSTNKKPRAEPHFLPETYKADNTYLGGWVQDDHTPFLVRGVEVLHLIPLPFPKVWHEISDDGEHLDMDTVEDWTKLVMAFTAEWMELEGFFDFKAEKRKGNIDKSELIKPP